jgi:hypothetical protein
MHMNMHNNIRARMCSYIVGQRKPFYLIKMLGQRSMSEESMRRVLADISMSKEDSGSENPSSPSPQPSPRASLRAAKRASYAGEHVRLAFPESTVKAIWPPGAPMPPELVDALRSQLRDLLADDESEEGTCRPRKSRPGTGPFSALLALKNQLSDSDPNSDAAAARRLQRTYKACVARRSYLQTKKAVRVIQSHRRGLTTRRQVAYDRAATTPADVFISHRVVESHHAALALKKALEERGLTVFVPNSFAHKDNAIKM